MFDFQDKKNRYKMTATALFTAAAMCCLLYTSGVYFYLRKHFGRGRNGVFVQYQRRFNTASIP